MYDDMMKLKSEKSFTYVPDGSTLTEALKRTTHLAIGAHPDDIEIMAFHGIQQGLDHNSFTAVIAADGAGSPRAGKYQNITDDQMIATRQIEQKKAAALGKYNLLLMLAHTSKEIKNPKNSIIIEELAQIFMATNPDVVYLHNIADKHHTHVALALKCLVALRTLPKNKKPKKVLGCEVWRSLDWLSDKQKVVLPTSANEDLALQLCQAHDSQIAGGKKYDLGTLGRRHANATFFESTKTDKESSLCFAMDLTTLIHEKTLNPKKLIKKHLAILQKEVFENLVVPSMPKKKK